MNPKRWTVLGAAVVVLLVAAFAVFRPDKLFVDQRVDEQLAPDVAAAVDGDAGSGDGAGTTTTTTTPGATARPGEAPSAPSTEAPAAPETPEVPAVLGRGEFVSQGGHQVVGTAVVVDRPEGRLLVLPELASENGPDLQLYLSPASAGSVDGGVHLGPLKGNLGTQTYSVPAGVDLGALPNVVIWCERFAVPFGTATLA